MEPHNANMCFGPSCVHKSTSGVYTHIWLIVMTAMASCRTICRPPSNHLPARNATRENPTQNRSTIAACPPHYYDDSLFAVLCCCCDGALFIINFGLKRSRARAGTRVALCRARASRRALFCARARVTYTTSSSGLVHFRAADTPSGSPR